MCRRTVCSDVQLTAYQAIYANGSTSSSLPPGIQFAVHSAAAPGPGGQVGPLPAQHHPAPQAGSICSFYWTSKPIPSLSPQNLWQQRCHALSWRHEASGLTVHLCTQPRVTAYSSDGEDNPACSDPSVAAFSNDANAQTPQSSNGNLPACRKLPSPPPPPAIPGTPAVPRQSWVSQ